jgi:ATP-dependent Lhr-like helicase|tara:strand:+ start:140 stop:5500 length:5361 start_codon:yes stop_codon:yes gene_type:complete
VANGLSKNMVKYITNRKSKEEVLNGFEPLIQKWFNSKFDDLTPPQSMAVPLIHNKENVLVSSPTGSGKTLTAFLSILNDFLRIHRKSELEDGVHAIYISPLKALANDIDRNLRQPLDEMMVLAEELNLDVPEIKVAVRSGDTSLKERARMVRKPPHILITTPESLGLLLSSKKFRDHFRKTRYIILDEIHDLANNKRGTHLSLSVERLAQIIETEPVRIGLSATQAPIEDIAGFLGGYSKGKPRPINIVDVKERKHLDLKVICPVDNLTLHSTEVINSKMYDLLVDLVNDHRTTLIFTNTRAGTESIALQLKERGIEKLAAHHGSLSKEMRLDVEEKLKAGEMDVVISSTSLELGIDIGYVDLVVQIGSPKSIAKGLQRIGRAGHALSAISKGRLVVFDPDDLIECAVLVRSAYKGQIDRVSIPEKATDVLAQSIIGMSLDRKWDSDEMYDLVSSAYPYRNMSKNEFLDVLDFLGGNKLENHGVYPKIWYDKKEKEIGIKRGSRQIYNMNIGTIPQEINYTVVLEGRGVQLGNLSEKFVENLSKNDIFVLGGRTYQFIESNRTTVVVKDGLGRKPTVPSWSGEMLPRSFDLSESVGKFRAEVEEKLELAEEEIIQWLKDEFRLDKGASKTIISHLDEQKKICGFVPSNKHLMVEGYLDNRGRSGAIFHFPFGRRVNDALSRAFAFQLGREVGSSVRISLSDDAFLLTFPTRLAIEGIADRLMPQSLEPLLRKAITNTEIFAQRFRHCANRSFMVLRNYKGREISLPRQQLRTAQVLEAINEIDTFPMLEEAYREVLHDAFDLKNAQLIIDEIKSGVRKIDYRTYSPVPSPLSHSLILSGLSDIVLMEDRSALLRELHTQVLGRVLEQNDGEKPRFEKDLIDGYFNEKKPIIGSREGLTQAIKQIGGIYLLNDREKSTYRMSDMATTEMQDLCHDMINEGHVESVWTGEKDDLFVIPELVPYYQAIYGIDEHLSKDAKKVYSKLKGIKEIKPKKISVELEKNYLVSKTPEGIRKRKIEKTISYEKALDWIIIKHLGFVGPQAKEDIALELRLSEDIVSQSLYDLEEQGTIQGGNFMLGRNTPQYLLAEDVIYLEAQSLGNIDVISENIYREYIDYKLFKKFPSLQTLFDQHNDVSSPRTVFHRLEKPDLNEWWEWRDSDAILQGRFSAGRLRYVPANKIGMYQALFRREPEGKIQNLIVDMLKRSPPLSKSEISKELEIKSELVDGALRALEEKLMIHRYNRHRNPWTTHNRYRLLNEYTAPEEPEKKVMIEQLRSTGPLTFAELRRECGLPLHVARNILNNLQEEDIVAKIVVVGATRLFEYCLKNEIDIIKKTKEEKKVRVVSWRDPILTHIRREMYSNYGEAWTNPIICGGMVGGYMEAWAMSGLLDVREVILEDNTSISNFLDALDEFATYQENFHSNIIRVKAFASTKVEELDSNIIEQFIEKGYQRIRNWLVKGPVIKNEYQEREIYGYLLWQQRINPEKRFTNATEAFREMGGVRSEYELSLRVQGRFFHPRDYGNEMELVQGVMIPGYATYCNVRDAIIYRDARNIPPEPDDRRLLALAIDSKGLPREELYRRSGMDPDSFKQSLARLYQSLNLVRTARGNYRTLPVNRIYEPKEARFRVVKRLILSFGIVSAERLGMLLKGEIPMAELRSILLRLEHENVLVKGFLKEGSETLYWIIKDDKDYIKGHLFQGSFVLNQGDRLSHYLSEDVKQKFGLGACNVIFSSTRMTGAFKMSKRGKDVIITEFIGTNHERHVIEAWCRQWRLNLDWELKSEEKVDI